MVMCITKSSEKIKKIALAFDESLETQNLDQVLDNFTDNCEIELLNIKLFGKDGVKKWFNWMFKHVVKFESSPITIMVEGNVFFEEFLVTATFYDGKKAQSKQAEVLIFENSKIKSLRLYFDRLDFSSSIAKDVISKTILNRIINKSIEGLE
jgi:ketosteroid isomerase-like protein